MSQDEVGKGTGIIRKVLETRIIFVPKVILTFSIWSLIFVSIGVIVLAFETVLKVFGINKKLCCAPGTLDTR